MPDQYRKYFYSWIQNPISEWLLLAGVTLLAALLRFNQLGTWSFWGDEVFSLSGQSDGFIRSTTVSLIQLTTQLMGESEWSARLVPALIGTLSVPLMYFPLSRAAGRRVALISASLLAVSTWHLYWSQNARFYILLSLLYTFAFLGYFISLEEDNPWLMVLSVVCFGLAAKERLLALLLIPVLIGYTLILFLPKVPKPTGLRARNLAIFFIPIGIIGGAFAWPFLRDVPGWLDGFGRINNNPFWLAAGTFYYISLPVVFIAGFSALYFIRRGNRLAFLASLGAALPLLAVMVLSLFHYTANRYVFISLTSFIILAGMGLSELFSLLEGDRRLLAFAILMLALGVSLGDDILYFRYQNGNRDNWKAAFEYIDRNDAPGDLVVVGNREIATYYLRQPVVSFSQFSPELLNEYERAWFVEDLTMEELFPEQRAWLRANVPLVADFDNHVYARVFTMRVYLYTRYDQ